MDTYRTISAPSSGLYTEKRSRFLAFAFPVATPQDVKIFVDEYQKKYYDARHVCYAYMLGAERATFRANDNGEPSGTAGKPILGQINSNELTNILIIVVRYFGGIKLGTSGLIQAYRFAAAEAIANATIIEKTIEAHLTLTFEYPLMNPVMKVLKDENAAILSQTFETKCEIVLSVRTSLYEPLKSKLQQIYGLTVTD